MDTLNRIASGIRTTAGGTEPNRLAVTNGSGQVGAADTLDGYHASAFVSTAYLSDLTAIHGGNSFSTTPTTIINITGSGVFQGIVTVEHWSAARVEVHVDGALRWVFDGSVYTLSGAILIPPVRYTSSLQVKAGMDSPVSSNRMLWSAWYRTI